MHIKHFQAWDPVSKMIVAKAYSTASSKSAASFLDEVIKEFPFKIKSIQVDGGSEFMADFERACEAGKIPLFVLPPKKPQWNGGVERANRTFREDFYGAPTFIPGTLQEVRQQLEKAVNIYNTFRPHMTIRGQTPRDYANNILNGANPSHII